MIWWQALVMMAVGMVGALLAVLLGGWLVFKTKTITIPTPFLQMPKQRKGDRPHSYARGLFPEDEELTSPFDEDLSPAAARLRDQKAEAPVPPEGGMKAILARVKGGKA